MNRRTTYSAALVLGLMAVGCTRRTEPTGTSERMEKNEIGERGETAAGAPVVGTTETTGAMVAAAKDQADKDKQAAVDKATTEGEKKGKEACEADHAKRAKAWQKAQAAKAAKAAAAEKLPERNTSTTLGDGSSGMYTGGKGSYGGQATWGTGGPNPPKP
jgi:ABC-type Fe3+-hydroxamate transport system substrate-binding protein